MKYSVPGWPASAILLGLFGISLLAMGVYFVVLRPSLLPEDFRYIGLSATQIDSAAPGLTRWLDRVFTVMGGHIFGAGVLTMTLAATAFRARVRGAALGVGVAGLTSIGWMVIVNFMIDSDFKWLLFAMAMLWASSLLIYRLEKASASHSNSII